MTDRPSASKARCPICRKPTTEHYRPFCSKRCADVDLSRWLGGHYAIPVQDFDDDEDGALPTGEAGEAGDDPSGSLQH